MSLRLDYVNDERHHCLARGEETKDVESRQLC
jgi:hypothetical protein